MTLLPTGACPSRRASLPSHLHPIEQAAASNGRPGSGRIFLPICSKHSHAGLAQLSSAKGDNSPASDSFALGGIRDLDTGSGGCGYTVSSIPFAMDLSEESSGSESSGRNWYRCPADSTHLKRRPSTNSKGYNVNFQKVLDEDFTLNNEVGHMSADLAHLVDRNKEAECVKAVHILERKSYENDDILQQPCEDMVGRGGCNTSGMMTDDGFDEHLWNSIMSEGDGQLVDRIPRCSEAEDGWQRSGRRSTHPNSTSSLISSSFQHINRVKADANEHCHRVIHSDY